MLFRSLSAFLRKHTVDSGTHWLALTLIVMTTAALLSGCKPHH
jgi:hypothetical protein